MPGANDRADVAGLMPAKPRGVKAGSDAVAPKHTALSFGLYNHTYHKEKRADQWLKA